MNDVCVSRCLAWAPDLTTATDWQFWAQGQKASSGEGAPGARAVPAMLRRRLTRWGRLALEVATAVAPELDPAAPVVFSSRHGDTERTQQLLRDLALVEPLSPTAFSLSVHNASLGLLTIVQHITAPSLALAAGRETFAHAWLEAVTWLDQGAPQVLLIHADEPLSGFYEPDRDEDDLPQALALLLTRDEGQRVSVNFTPATTDMVAGSRSLALDFLAWWYGEQRAFTYVGDRLAWTWKRDDQAD